MIVRSAAELGHLVRDYRSRKRLTQAQLAALVGASRKWIVDLEGGKRTADLSLVLRTLNVIGVDLHARDRASGRIKTTAIELDEIIDRTRNSKR